MRWKNGEKEGGREGGKYTILPRRIEKTRLLMDAAIQILHHQAQDPLVKLISAIQQEALSQEDQLKVYGALRPD